MPTVAARGVTGLRSESDPPTGSTRLPPPCCAQEAGPCLDMVFPAASERGCVILRLCVVCGTPSMWASAGSGRVTPRPRPAASGGILGQQRPLTLV